MKKIFNLLLLCAMAIFASCSSSNDSGPTGIESVTVNPSSAEVAIGMTVTLAATVTPGDVANKNVTWSSDKTGIATVDKKGVVTGVAEGTATITAKAVDGGKTGTCTVTVKIPSILGTWGVESKDRSMTMIFSEDGNYTIDIKDLLIETGAYTYTAKAGSLRITPKTANGKPVGDDIRPRTVLCKLNVTTLTINSPDIISNGHPHDFKYPLTLTLLDN